MGVYWCTETGGIIDNNATYVCGIVEVCITDGQYT